MLYSYNSALLQTVNEPVTLKSRIESRNVQDYLKDFNVQVTLVWMEFPVNKKSIINNSTMPQIYL